MKHLPELRAVKLPEAERANYEAMFTRNKTAWCETTYRVCESVAYTVHDSIIRIMWAQRQGHSLARDLWSVS